MSLLAYIHQDFFLIKCMRNTNLHSLMQPPKNGEQQSVYKINKPEKVSTLLTSAVICDNAEKI